MLKLTPAKINIGLQITGKRHDDGYHELQTVFYPIKIYDAVEVLPAHSTSIRVWGSDLAADQNNLCMQAYRMLQEDMALPPVEIHLLKRIPVGAGLGGGSSDATATLTLLNQLFSLDLSQNQLFSYAKRLGADCPFFLSNRGMFAEGIGTDLTPVEVDLEAYHIVVVKPDISISTAEAYAGVKPRPSEVDLRNAIRLPVQEWRCRIKNDFEDTILVRYPQISKLKNTFYEIGALYASMSGSGSAVFGIFNSLENDWDRLKHYGEVFLPQG